MAAISTMLLSLLIRFLLFFISYSSNKLPQVYVIHMNTSQMPAPFSTSHHSYVSMLSAISIREEEADVISSLKHLYTYQHVISGFSALLPPSHLQQIQSMPGHLTTFPETPGEFHTTHTPKFLGLKENVGLRLHSGFGDDMIIGMMDSRIWPESESFNNERMPSVPARWKGACEKGAEFDSSSRNKKLIGARSFSKAMKAAGWNIISNLGLRLSLRLFRSRDSCNGTGFYRGDCNRRKRIREYLKII